MLWLGAAFLLVAAPRAMAAGVSAVSSCHAFSDEGESYRKVASDPARWTCDADHWTSTRKIAWLRFDLAGNERPERLVTRVGAFRQITVGVIHRDGPTSWREYGMSDAKPLSTGPLFSITLPAIPVDAKAVIVRISGHSNVPVLSQARLLTNAQRAGWKESTRLVVAMLCGLLFAPLAFNFAFYNVLRARFVVWHGTMTAGMLSFTMISSGIVNDMFTLDLLTLAVLNATLFTVPFAASGFFSADFLEPDFSTPAMRRALRGAGFWVLATSMPLSVIKSVFPPFGSVAYLLSLLPALLIYITVMIQALRRGSRAARFQIAGWIPMVLVLVERALRSLNLYEAPEMVDQAILLAVTINVLATAMGVADRFMTIRGQRDRAILRGKVLEALCEHDPLTGLLNRRAIEPRFHEAYNAGFFSMALIDIDNFKDINDSLGHSKGDQVLKAVAEALSPDDDTLAVRMGGEEFLLLFRGPNAVARAEQRRQAIPGRVAAAVSGMDRMVTASMGLVEQRDSGKFQTNFASLYARCDRLLYEAKRNGRNRTVHERLQGFTGKPITARAA